MAKIGLNGPNRDESLPTLAPPPQPDYEGLLKCLRREGTPQRVYFMELFLDEPVKNVISKRFGLQEHLDPNDPWFYWKREIRLQRFLGYDYVTAKVPTLEFPRFTDMAVPDTVDGEQSMGNRIWLTEKCGSITNWEDFEKYPWPDPAKLDLSVLEWLENNLPDDMCMTTECHSIFEQLNWLMGLENLCYSLYDQPDLVEAIVNRVGEIYLAAARTFVQFDRLKFLFGGDDMGHKTGTLISPEHIRRLILPWHKKIAEVAHQAGRLNLLHSCGNIRAIMPDLIDYVGIDGKHSFEDTIEQVTEAKRLWGDRIALIGGIDMDFLCRADEQAIRKRVRETLDVCMPGGGYCLGTGNTVANYVPLRNYLAMLDEGRRYGC